MALTVFVSYSKEDLAFVARIRDAFAGDPAVNVFNAEHDVPPGEPLDRRIEQAIQACDLFVLLWSANAASSEWVRHEIGISAGKNKPILPILLDRDASLPSFLQNRKFVEAFEDPNQGLQIVRETILEKARIKGRNEATFAIFGIAVVVVLVIASKE